MTTTGARRRLGECADRPARAAARPRLRQKTQSLRRACSPPPRPMIGSISLNPMSGRGNSMRSGHADAGRRPKPVRRSRARARSPTSMSGRWRPGCTARTRRSCSTAIAVALVEAGVALLRGHVSTQTLHPQWTGYGYTWHRRLNAVHEQQFARAATPTSAWLQSPFFDLIERARAGEATPTMRRRLCGGSGAARLPRAGRVLRRRRDRLLRRRLHLTACSGDPAHGAGVVLSFATDRVGRLRRRRHHALGGDAARPRAGAEGACGP